MTRLFPLLPLMVILGSASAQVKIGSVTLTKPTSPAPTQSARASSASTSNSTGKGAMTSVPAGWYEVKGRVGAGSSLSLPAGSTVSVLMEDQTARGQFVRIQFRASRLSTPYQIIFSPGRLNSSHRYTIRASVTDSSGKVLYQSSAYNVPTAARNVIDLPVR